MIAGISNTYPYQKNIQHISLGRGPNANDIFYVFLGKISLTTIPTTFVYYIILITISWNHYISYQLN